MNDLISRQAAIDWLKNKWDGMVTSVFKGIENLPSAQPTVDVVEVEKVNKIYEKLEDLFDIPCNFSPCDEIMLESERCRKDCGNISGAECWRRYFEVVCDGERADR